MTRRRERGFTLVEGIMVLVITSILAGIMVLFIRRPVQSYVDSAARADMADVADIALRRMMRELRGAVPNSIRWQDDGTTTLLEFIPTKAGGRYLAEEDGVTPTTRALSFTDTTALNFDIVGTVPSGQFATAPGDFIIVYNLGSGFTDADAYLGGNRGTVQTVTSVNGGTNNRIGLASNPFAVPFANGRLPNTSPDKRFSVATGPVTFVCVNDTVTGRGTLTRFWGYGFPVNQVNPATINGAPSARMAANVFACRFNVTQMANQNTALIGLSIALARSAPGASANGLETATLTQQVHVENTP